MQDLTLQFMQSVPVIDIPTFPNIDVLSERAVTGTRDIAQHAVELEDFGWVGEERDAGEFLCIVVCDHETGTLESFCLVD